MKQRAYGDGRGGGGGAAKSRYRLSMWERVMLFGVVAFNAITSLFNLWSWCRSGSLLNFICGFVSACFTLWVIQRNRQWL